MQDLRSVCFVPKKVGVEILDHRWSKLGKLQAPKARSCDCRSQEAPYD